MAAGLSSEHATHGEWQGVIVIYLFFYRFQSEHLKYRTIWNS